MKKVFSTLLAAGFIALVACGPSAEENKTEQAATETVDSAAATQEVAAVDSAAMTTDSTAAPAGETK
ncbi:MAG: hypothetical protein ACKO1U_06965 [Bacteroidota bacterium]